MKRITDPLERDLALGRWDQALTDTLSYHASARAKLESVALAVQQSYGIRPPAGEREIVNGPFAKAKVSWNLGVQVDRDDIRVATTPGGESRYLRFPKDQDPDDRVAGLTTDDGKVLLGIGAFAFAEEIDPGILALAIYHESIHFEQLRTTGWETRAKIEAEAYSAILLALKDIDIPLPARRNTVFKAVTWNAVRAGELLSPVKTPPPFTPDAEDRDNRAEFEGRLADIKGEQEALAGEIKRRAQERRAREAREAAAEQARQREREEDRARVALDRLKTLVKNICGMGSDTLWFNPNMDAWYGWRDGYFLDLPVLYANVDMSILISDVSCEVFLENQIAIVARREVAAGRRRTAELEVTYMDGLISRYRAANRPPATPPRTAPPPGPTPPPPAAEDPEEPAGPNPTTPSIPYCRYHPWCQEPKK